MGWDDVGATLLGAGVGAALEFGKDEIVEHRAPTAGELVGAAVSGGIMGEAIDEAPATGGASIVVANATKGGIAAAVGNLAQQYIDVHTGKQKEYSATSLAVSTTVGAVTGGALSTKTAGKIFSKTNIPGVTSGRGNWLSSARGVITKIERGSASRISAKTALKGAVGAQAAASGKTAAGVTIDGAKTWVCSHVSKCE